MYRLFEMSISGFCRYNDPETAVMKALAKALYKDMVYRFADSLRKQAK